MVSHVGVTPNLKLFCGYFINCNFATIMNYNVSIWYAGYLIYNPKRMETHRLRTTGLEPTRGRSTGVLVSPVLGRTRLSYWECWLNMILKYTGTHCVVNVLVCGSGPKCNHLWTVCQEGKMSVLGPVSTELSDGKTVGSGQPWLSYLGNCITEQLGCDPVIVCVGLVSP